MNFNTPGIPGIAAVIPGKSAVTSLKFHEEGKVLYVASEGDSHLQVIDCLNGKADGPALRAEREQIHEIGATHHEKCILFAGKGSTIIPIGQRNAVCYWSLHDNKILRKFRGHQDRVSRISMSPADDSFLTSSADRTVRLWDLKQAGGIAELKLPSETSGGPLACFDSTGLVFAVAASMSDSEGYYVHLYDARNYGVGAFAEFKLSQHDANTAIQAQPGAQNDGGLGSIHSLFFNTSGSQVLLSGANGHALILDGFEGTIQRALSQPNRSEKGFLACCFSSDDKSLLQGNDEGGITCWDLASGSVLQTLQGHESRIQTLAWNPKYNQIASSCEETCLWLW